MARRKRWAPYLLALVVLALAAVVLYPVFARSTAYSGPGPIWFAVLLDESGAPLRFHTVTLTSRHKNVKPIRVATDAEGFFAVPDWRHSKYTDVEGFDQIGRRKTAEGYQIRVLTQRRNAP